MTLLNLKQSEDARVGDKDKAHLAGYNARLLGEPRQSPFVQLDLRTSWQDGWDMADADFDAPKAPGEAKRTGQLSVFVNEWCAGLCGEEAFNNAIRMTDGVCPCGCWKHHYHCAVCKKIVQVG